MQPMPSLFNYGICEGSLYLKLCFRQINGLLFKLGIQGRKSIQYSCRLSDDTTKTDAPILQQGYKELYYLKCQILLFYQV